MKNKLWWFGSLCLVLVLTGCETVKGVGKDITGVGSAVQSKMSGAGRNTDDRR